jgi:hypothetical protein
MVQRGAEVSNEKTALGAKSLAANTRQNPLPTRIDAGRMALG